MTQRAVIRRVFVAALAAIVVFAAGFVLLPERIADLTTQHFSGDESVRMFIAVKVGDGLEFDGWRVPITLETDAWLGSADTPGTPEHPAFPFSVRFIRVQTAGVLMETIKRDDDGTLTCRYLVQGRRIVPVSQRSFGLIDKFLAALMSVGLATLAAIVVTGPALLSMLRKRRAAQP